MISVYEGKLGGGKSYHAVRYIIRYLSKGGRVYTNIILVREECEKIVRKRFGVELKWDEQVKILNPDEIKNLHKVVKGGTKESRTIAVIDELHLYHNARDWGSASRDLLAWLTASRHYYVDIIFITQSRWNVDKQWIRLIAGFWSGRDLREWTIPVIGKKWPLPQFLWCQYDQDGRTLVRRDFEFIDRDIFKCYSSDQLFDGVGDCAGRGLGRVDLEKVKGKNKMRFAIVAVVFIIGIIAAFRLPYVAEKLGYDRTGKFSETAKKPEKEERQYQNYPPIPSLPPEPVFYEIEPEVIVHDAKTGNFKKAYVNGHWTTRQPIENKFGETVYIIAQSDIKNEIYRDMWRKATSGDFPTNASLPAYSPTNNPRRYTPRPQLRDRSLDGV